MHLRHVSGETVAADPADARALDAEAGRILASDVEIADTFRTKTKGMMFREEVPADYALVFEFDDPPWWTVDALALRRSIHMLFVKVPLDVLWLREGRVRRVGTLSPWTGFGTAKADTVIEMQAGAAEGVDVGDVVHVIEAD